MFIQAVDDKFYENIIIEGDDYVIKAYEIESPEIVVMATTATPATTRRRAYQCLKKIGIQGRLSKSFSKDLYWFPNRPTYLLPGYRWELEIKSKIPVPTGYKCRVDYPRSDTKFLAWELDFPTNEIQDYLAKRKFNSLLLTFLMGKEIYSLLQLTKRQQSKIIAFLTKMLAKSSHMYETITIRKEDY